MTNQTFAATVGEWVHDVKEAQVTIFQESLQRLVTELNTLVPVGRTAFLRSSLQASQTEMPALNRPNPGKPDEGFMGAIELVINNVDITRVVFLGYSAEYGGHVHWGTSKMAGRPWVTMCAQRWPAIVAEVEAEVLARLGLN